MFSILTLHSPQPPCPWSLLPCYVLQTVPQKYLLLIFVLPFFLHVRIQYLSYCILFKVTAMKPRNKCVSVAVRINSEVRRVFIHF
jgi:hypothetical protein